MQAQIPCEKKRDGWDWAKMVAEFFGLGVLIIYTIFTIRIWYANRDAVNITREQVHIGQRAYLYLHNAVLVSTPKTGEGLLATLDLTNNGQTPARDVYYSSDFSISQGLPQAMSSYLPLSPVPPGQKLVVVMGLMNRLTDSDLENITAKLPSLNGNILTIPVGPRLYLRVITKYKDVFGGDGEDEFCGIYDVSTNKFLSCADHIDSMK